MKRRRREALREATKYCIDELFKKDLSLADVTSFFTRPTTQTRRELRKKHPRANLDKCTFFKIIHTPAEPERLKSLSASRRYAEKMAAKLVKASDDPRALESFRGLWNCQRIGHARRCTRPVKGTFVRKVDGGDDASYGNCDVDFFPLQYADRARTIPIARDPFLGCVERRKPDAAFAAAARSKPDWSTDGGDVTSSGDVAKSCAVINWAMTSRADELVSCDHPPSAHDVAYLINESGARTGRHAHVVSDITQLYDKLANQGDRVISLLCIRDDGSVVAIRREGARYGINSSRESRAQTFQVKDFFYPDAELSLQMHLR